MPIWLDFTRVRSSSPPILFDGGFAMGRYYTAFEEGAKADQAVAFAAFDKAVKGAEVSSEWRAVSVVQVTVHLDNAAAAAARRFVGLQVTVTLEPNK